MQMPNLKIYISLRMVHIFKKYAMTHIYLYDL